MAQTASLSACIMFVSILLHDRSTTNNVTVVNLFVTTHAPPIADPNVDE